MKTLFQIILAITLTTTLPTLVNASSLENIHFIKISPIDAKAVIKNAGGKLQVIKPGDVVAEGVTVKEIVTGRIVLEEKTGKGVETVFVMIVNDKAKIERMSKQPGNRPVLVAPAKN